MSSVSQKIHLRDEMKKLHLVDKTGGWRALISLRCAVCKRLHPKSPAALVWWKALKDKDMLRCPCGSKNFVQTDAMKSQGELIGDAIHKHTTHLKRIVEDEVGDESEGARTTRQFNKKYLR